jgi:hypothetical protein
MPAAAQTSSAGEHSDAGQVAARMAEELLQEAAATAADADAPGDPVAGPQPLPLAGTALLWVGGSAAAAMLLFRPGGRRAAYGPPAVAAVLTVAVLGPAVVHSFAVIWGGGTGWGPADVGYVALAAAGFTALQAAVLRLAGVPGLPVLGLLYLVAAPLATRPLDLLVPVHRVLLWFRNPSPFAVESWSALASPQRPLAGCVALGGFLVAGLAVLLWPRCAAGPTPRPCPRRRAGVDRAAPAG